jgi:mannosylglycerate hydrolase
MPGYTFHLIPHTHWDREWYLPQSVFLARLVPTIDHVIAQLQRNPETTFLLDGQTVLLEDYLRVRPEEEPRLAELVRSGRLQIGPWYVLSDELIPSGESLIRNLLVGQADSTSLGGRTEVLYSPDAFGHPAVWPQLAGEFGIRFGVVWRGLGGEADQQHDLYRWRGPDGRDVLLYHLPPDGYEVGATLPADPELLPRAWSRVRTALVARAATRQIAVFVGADHHAPHPDLAGLRTLLAQLEAGSDVRLSRLQDFFVAAAEEAGTVPTISGDLRWSYGYTWTLQGVHATRAPLKRRHVDAELLLIRTAEPLAALGQQRDRKALLQHAWRLLLQCQFHDSLGGCTSDVVAEQVRIRLDDARRLALEIARSSLDQLAGNDPDRSRSQPDATAPQLLLWNPVPRRRDGVVVADLSWFRRDILVGPPGDRLPRMGPGARPFHLVSAEGPVAVQVLGQARGQERLDAPHHYPDQDQVDWTRVALRMPELRGFGLASLDVGRGPATPTGGAWLKARTLGNEFLELRVDPDGSVQLRDRRSGQLYRNILSLETSGDIGDTYSYCPPPRDRVRRAGGPAAVRGLAAGPLVAAVELRRQISLGPKGLRGIGGGTIGVRLILALWAGSPVLRCTLEIDNQATNHRLRLRVPTGLPGDSALAGEQFGSVERVRISSDARNYPRETPVTTAPAHRYVARAVKGRGLAVLAPGFFEYELEPQGDLLITILRAVGQLSRETLATRRGHAGWPVATPGAQCLGRDSVQLGLAPVTQSQLAGGAFLPHLWEDLFLPPQGIWLRQASPLNLNPVDLRLEGDGLIFSALKPAERGDGLVLRCYNASDRPASGAWHFGQAVSTAQRARADEQPLHEIRLGEGRLSIPFHAAPHEIVTILVSLGEPG